MIKSKLLFLAAAVLTALCSCASGGPAQSPALAQSPEPIRYFSGDGGRGRSITILPLTARGLSEGQSYLPDTVQGELMADFSKYSAISVFDRINLEKNYAELLSGYYDDASRAALDLGHLPPTDYFLNGSITKTSAGYALQIQVSKTADNMAAASYSGTCTFDELDSLAGVRRASRKLLEDLGVALSGQAKTELDGPATEQAAGAQIALSRGIAAMRNGTVVEALSYFIQSANIDPDLAEAASRVNIVGADISSGSIGTDTRNEIAWRRAWVNRLNECDNYVADYIKNTPLPTYLVYSTNLKKGEIDWDRETLALSFRMALYPDKNWPLPLQGVMNAVYAGLAATGRASTWKLEWPTRAASGGMSPIRAEVNREYLTAVELLNDRGQVIGTQSILLQAGWKTDFTGPNAPRASNEGLGLDTAARESNTTAVSVQTVETVTFPYVDAEKITGRLSIRIVRLNGRSVETAAKANAVSIMTEAAYTAIFEQQLNMTSIPGGTFMMGGPNKNEQPRHRETVAPFYMGKYEVTVGEYRAFLTGTGQKINNLYESGDNPVDNVSWLDAVRYCNWLSEKTGRKPAYTIPGNDQNDRYSRGSPDNVVWDPDADGYRLPTEAEWEYACRAGTTTAYSFGDSISPSQARYNEDRRSGMRYPVPVGSFAPNPWGLYDMHGNVSEWCWDYAAEFGGHARAIRGGHYLSYAGNLRSAFRRWSSPGNAAGNGFRVVHSGKEVLQPLREAAREEEPAERRRIEERLAQGIYKAGETGPAGGLVFYDKGSASGGWRFLEAAPVSTEFEAGYYEAARQCKALTVNGFGNWRLPKKDELNLMYTNLGQKKLGDFSGASYWSSSGFLFFYSWVVRFSDGYDGIVTLRSSTAKARAVRAF
jgi:formylglycine-generating enzyme required for sulfatase activity/TolB-like protein